tara:strand:+ start:190 stop:450 length:261 start_codon:yes stop_codon:yes gene_type:complete
MSNLKLTKKQKEELQRLANEIMNLSTEVVKDYELTPSEVSGSTVQINENSPFLDGEFKGDGWKKVIRGSVEEAISMIKNKDKDATE